MGRLAFDIESGELIDLVQLLETKSFEDLAKQFADRPNAYCCAECLVSERGLTDAQLAEFRAVGLAPDSSFRRGSIQKRLDLETGEYKPTPCRPAFWHTTKLIDEDGNPIERPCESDQSVHHGFCRYIAGAGQGWLLGTGLDEAPLGAKADRHVISVMARYVKDPSHREPDISVLWANSVEDAKQLEARFAAGERTIDWSLCSGLTAVEVQKSPISKPALIARTRDHLKHFPDVRWVFTAGNKPVPAREWLADAGLPAFVIEEEVDKSSIIGVRELPPPKKTKTYDVKRTAIVCFRYVLLYWLRLGYAMPEAFSRAKADADDLKAGKYLERYGRFDQQLDALFPSRRLDPKQIWLRQQRREADNR